MQVFRQLEPLQYNVFFHDVPLYRTHHCCVGKEIPEWEIAQFFYVRLAVGIEPLTFWSWVSRLVNSTTCSLKELHGSWWSLWQESSALYLLFFGSSTTQTKILCTPSLTQLGFELMTSRSWQYFSCHWDTCVKGQDWQATVCCKVGAAALVHLRPVLGGCTILPFNHLAMSDFRTVVHRVSTLDLLQQLCMLTMDLGGEHTMWYMMCWEGG